MAQETQTGALYQSGAVGWGRRWEGRSRGRGYVSPMADSCWGLTENHKILQSNYPSIKKIQLNTNPINVASFQGKEKVALRN